MKISSKLRYMYLPIVPPLSCDMDRKKSSLAGLVGICFLGEKELHNVFMSILTGLIESGGAICCLAVYVRTWSTAISYCWMSRAICTQMLQGKLASKSFWEPF